MENGVLAAAQTEILFLKDTDGDNVADVREVWFDGFTPAHPQMQIGNPRFGLDNWIYCNYGPGTISAAGKDGERPLLTADEAGHYTPERVAAAEALKHPGAMALLTAIACQKGAL